MAITPESTSIFRRVIHSFLNSIMRRAFVEIIGSGPFYIGLGLGLMLCSVLRGEMRPGLGITALYWFLTGVGIAILRTSLSKTKK